MIRVFVDASVLFSACYSASGASRELIRFAIQGQVALVISDVVREEASRNLNAKAPQALPFLDMCVLLFRRPHLSSRPAIQQTRR